MGGSNFYDRLVYERLRAGASEAFAGTPVQFAYLFGSQARGRAGPASDVDLAVHLGGTPASLALHLELVRRVHAATGIETEIVVLDEAPLRLIERVLRDGRLIFSADEPVRVCYESTMRRVCADFAIHADPLDNALIRATSSGAR